MSKSLFVSAFIVIGLFSSASSVRGQHFQVNVKGPIVLRTNHSVTQVIEVTRLDTASNPYLQQLYVQANNPNNSQFFGVNVVSYDLPMNKDSMEEVTVIFTVSGGLNSDTVLGSVSIGYSDSTYHLIDSIQLIGIMDYNGGIVDTLSIEDTTQFEVQKIGDEDSLTFEVTNPSNQPMTIDTLQILGNTHSCFDVEKGLHSGQIIEPLQTTTFVVRYQANGVTYENVSPFVVSYHDPAGDEQSFVGSLQANSVSAIVFDLPDTLPWGFGDSVTVLNLDSVAACVNVYGTIPVTSYISEPSSMYWSSGFNSTGGFCAYVWDTSASGVIPSNTTSSCAYIFSNSPNDSGYLTSYSNYSTQGMQTGNNYQSNILYVEENMFPPDPTRWTTTLFHNQTIGIPLELMDSILDSIVFPTSSMWLTNGTPDTLHVKVAQLWNGTNFSANIHRGSTPFTLAPGQEIQVDFSFTPGNPDTQTIGWPSGPSLMYYYYDEFIVETDSSYDPGLNQTRVGANAIPYVIPSKSNVSQRFPSLQPAMEVYPNPASTSATLQYSLVDEESISITIYDALGRIVATPIVNQIEGSGLQEISFPTNDLPSGIYSCRLSMGDVAMTAKLVVIQQ
jgi:Secretion system C-terminal sorting domain